MPSDPARAGASRPPPRLAFVDAFRALAIVQVVGLHAPSFGELPDVPLGSAIVRFVATISVPAFFLADGYLFGLARRRDPGFALPVFLERSARRLLLPWILFTVLYGLAQAAAERAGLASRPILEGASPSRVLLLAWGSAFSRQLYFLPSLFLIRSLAALWCRLARTPWPSLLAAWALYATLEIAWLGPELKARIHTPGLDPLVHAFWGLQFYLAGMLCAALDAAIRRRAAALLAAAIAIGILALWIAAPPVFQYAYLLGAYLLFLVSAPLTRALHGIGRHTMGIYLLHQPVLMKLVALAAGALFAGVLPRYGIQVFGAFLAAWGASVLLSRHAAGRWILGESGELAPARRALPTG